MLDEIPFAYTVNHSVDVENCEYIPDAYEVIMQAVLDRKIILEKYKDINSRKKEWIKNMIMQEYSSNQTTDEYKYFLINKFPFVSP
ncbi:MAG: hypothetical protein HFG28_11970 [Eubacterium sp.]|nr:hypothetical protein [Eubacterium sp.]